MTMSRKPGKPIVFSILCALYGVLTLLGYVLFSEAQWVRDFKGTSHWSASLGNLESWIKGSSSLSASAPDALVLVGEIRGEDALLVRDFSSLVFRSAHQNEFLSGRNVLLTKDGVHARLWLVDYDTWLEMQPNTLIVLDQSRSELGERPVLNLSVLAGSWNLREIQETEVESIVNPQIREDVKTRRESRKIASQGRDPSSTSSSTGSSAGKPQLPGIQVQDFVAMKEFESQGAGQLSEARDFKSIEIAQADTKNENESGVEQGEADFEVLPPVDSFWGESAQVEGMAKDGGLGSELKTLAKLLEVKNEEKVLAEPAKQEFVEPLVEEAVVVKAAQESGPKKQSKGGSLASLDKVFAAETSYIASVIKTGRGGRNPSASSIGLSMALEKASSTSIESTQFNSAMSQVLSDYLDLYLTRGECGMVSELRQNVLSNYAQSSERLNWEKNWSEKVAKSPCRKMIQAKNTSRVDSRFVGETHYIKNQVSSKRAPASDSLSGELLRSGDTTKYGSGFNDALAQVLDVEIASLLRVKDCLRAEEIVHNARKSYAESTILLNWEATWSKILENANCSQ